MNKQIIFHQTAFAVFSVVASLLSVFAVPIATIDAFQATAYTNAAIETIGEQGRLENATLVVRDGKIEAVGTDVAIPDDARIVQLNGSTIMPGIIDPYYVFSRTPQANDVQTVTFNGRTFTIPSDRGFQVGAFETISDYFYPYEHDFRPFLRSGVTTANLVSDGRGLSAIANLTINPTDEMLFEKRALLFAQVTNQTSALDIVRKGLDPNASVTASTRGGRGSGSGRGVGGRPGGGPGSGATPVATPSSETKPADKPADSNEALWTEVREGKKTLIVNVNNAATVAHLLKLLDKYDKVKLCLVSTGPNIFESLDEIKNRNVSLVVQPTIESIPFNSQLMNAPRMIAEKDIPLAFSLSLNKGQMRGTLDDPMFPIAVLVKTGLKREAALEALTLAPARFLGIDATHGSIEKGKVANFLIFGGDPLATQSELRQVIVQGKPTHEN